MTVLALVGIDPLAAWEDAVVLRQQQRRLGNRQEEQKGPRRGRDKTAGGAGPHAARTRDRPRRAGKG